MVLDDRAAVGLAVAAAGGTWLARPVPLAAAAAAVAMAIVARRPWWLLLAVLVLASCLGARAWAGLEPAATSTFQGRVVLVTDPEDTFGGVRAVVHHGDRRLELTARARGAGILRSRLAGEAVVVSGRVSPPPQDSTWFAIRHVVGRLEASSVDPGGSGSAPWRLGNAVRRTLTDGAASLAPDRRALFTGLVLGDDRDQPPTMADDFRGAGLAHLLAVSGENVAFVLVLAGPILRRLRLGARWVVTLTLVAGFALVTRFEPSVLRASVMAALAVTASTLGRQVGRGRVLALAVTVLVLVDPLLVRSVGFQLSVAASAGISVLAAPLARLIRRPAVLGEALGVTAAAQLGVAPVLIATFGGLPVVSVPANLLVAPAAGPVMVWGLPAGLVAGVVGEPVAGWLHRPTDWLVAWIELVARMASRAPLGDLRTGEVAVVTIGCALILGSRQLGRSGVGRLGVALALVGLLGPVVVLRAAPPAAMAVARDVTVERAGGATVVVLASAAVDPADLLEGLRRAGVRRVDLVVVSGGGPASARLVEVIGHRWRPGRVLAPAGHAVPGATTPPPGAILDVGGLTVIVDAIRPKLVVRVEHQPAAAADRTRGPP